MGRLIIISNRLPFSLDREGDKLTIRQSSGGLVSAIKSYFENSAQGVPHAPAPPKSGYFTERLWIGVADFPQESWDEWSPSFSGQQEFNILPVFIDKELYD